MTTTTPNTITPRARQANVTSLAGLILLLCLTQGTHSFANAAPAHQLPVGHFVAAKFPLTAIHPRPDDETPPGAYHRVAYPGMRWDCPVRAAFGAYPYDAELIAAPAGMTLGSWLARQADGTWTEDASYCTLTWPQPTAGTHPITVRITDQEGASVTFAWTLVVDRLHHYFAGSVASGKGDGSSRADQAAFAGVYGPSDAEPSPARGKVVVLASGSYPLTAPIHLAAAQGKPVSIMAYPGDTPELVSTVPGVKVYHSGSDSMLTGLRLRGFRISSGGVISTHDYADRLTVWRNAFVDCAGDPKVNNNESAWFCARTSGSVKRKHLLMAENTYTGCVDMAAMLFYAVGPLLSERDVFLSEEPKLLEPVWFPKAVCDFDLRRHRFDNPGTGAPTYGVIDPSNNVEGGTASGEVRYNFVRAKEDGSAVFWNGSATAATQKCHDYRNTYIGAKVVAKDWLALNQVGFAANVIQNPQGGIDRNSAGFTATETECHGTDGIVDANGRLTGTYRSAYLGRRGCEIAGPCPIPTVMIVTLNSW